MALYCNYIYNSYLAQYSYNHSTTVYCIARNLDYLWISDFDLFLFHLQSFFSPSPLLKFIKLFIMTLLWNVSWKHITDNNMFAKVYNFVANTLRVLTVFIFSLKFGKRKTSSESHCNPHQDYLNYICQSNFV